MNNLVVSLFNDRSGTAITPAAVSWAQFVDAVANSPVAPDKANCQLFSLCEFGEKRTEAGSLRSNDNVLRVWGAVGDYDGEVMPMQEAAAKLHAAGVLAVLYTSPSHRPDAPRWRVVAPFSEPGDKALHAVTVERINGVLGGVLSSESFTLSQPFYVGRVQGQAFESIAVHGAPIDKGFSLPRLPWRGARNSDGTYSVSTETLLDDLRSGVEVHPAIVALAARGFSAEELSDIVRQHCSGWQRPERGQVAIEQDIPRAVASWERKKRREVEAMLATLPVPPKPEPVNDFIPVGEVLFDVGEFITTPPRQNWLIKGIVEDKTHVSVFGDSGAGKSFLVIDWALSIAAGREWQGHKVSRGGVAYLNGEGFDGWRRRIAAWIKHNKASPAELSTFVATKRCWPLTNPDGLNKVWLALDALQARVGVIKLVIIDTLNRHVLGLDINSSSEMGRFVELCDEIRARYGCCVLIVHHSGTKDKDRAMGSVALKGALDVEVNVRRKGSNVTVSSTKMKDSEPFPDMHFRISDVQLDWLVNPDAGPDEVPERQKAGILERVADPDATGDPNTPGQPGRPSQSADLIREVLREGKLTVDEARDAFCRLHSGARPAAAKAFNRALKGMIAGGSVIHVTDDDTVALPLNAVSGGKRT